MRKLLVTKDLKTYNKIMKIKIDGFISKSDWCILPSIRLIKQSKFVAYRDGVVKYKEHHYYDFVLSFLCFSLWISFVNKEIK